MSEQGPRQLDEITAAWQQAKDAFEESERRYRNLVEHSLGLICTHDLDGRLLSINPAAARSLGYEPEHGRRLEPRGISRPGNPPSVR